MFAIRSEESTSELLFNVAYKETQFKKQPEFLLKKYNEITGMDLMGKWPEEKPLPWDKYVTYDKDKMIMLLKNAIGKHAR